MRRLLAVAASASALQRSSQSIRLPTRRHSSVRNALQDAVERLRAASVAEPEASAVMSISKMLSETIVPSSLVLVSFWLLFVAASRF